MLTLEPPSFTIQGYQIFRDFSDPDQFYYLPSEHAHVADNGKALQFVVYTEDIENEPNFDQSADHAGGFLTVEVELDPDPNQVEQLKSALSSASGSRPPKPAPGSVFEGYVKLTLLC